VKRPTLIDGSARFQERRALQVELKQTVAVNVPIEERGQGPENLQVAAVPRALGGRSSAELGSC
jgi:hypothetical protein